MGGRRGGGRKSEGGVVKREAGAESLRDVFRWYRVCERRRVKGGPTVSG